MKNEENKLCFFLHSSVCRGAQVSSALHDLRRMVKSEQEEGDRLRNEVGFTN